jgi:hypothetical protein
VRWRPHRSRIERSRCHGGRPQKFQSQWSPTIARLERPHNLDVMARMLLYGESRFLSRCDFKRLRVVKRSRATTSTLRARQRTSSRRGQPSATGLRKVPMPPRGCWFRDRFGHQHRLSDYIGQCIPNEPTSHKHAVGLLVLQQASMPRQRLRSIPNRFRKF